MENKLTKIIWVDIGHAFHGRETILLYENEQRRLQVRENNWAKRLAGVMRVDRRRMDDLKEVGIERCLMRQ